MNSFLTSVEDRLKTLNLPEEPRLLYEPIKYTVQQGGKRVRPQLVAIGCGITGGNPEYTIEAALAVELLHTFTLIHDDIMDQAETRRGNASVYAKWDENVAILSGDALFAFSIQQLERYSESTFSPTLYPALMKEFLRSTLVVCEGQSRDMAFPQQQNVTLEDYLEMIGQKTAALLSSSLVMGGLIAGASQEDIERLRRIGTQAGLAFQIQDDYLDAFGDPSTFGKKVGGDLREGKITYLTLSFMERASVEQKTQFQAIFGKNDASQSQIDELISMMRSVDIDKITETRIRSLYDSVHDEISHFTPSDFTQALESILHALLKRNN